MNKWDLDNLHSVVFNIKMLWNFNLEPELYFIPDSEITLNEKTPFLPMPLVDRV